MRWGLTQHLALVLILPKQLLEQASQLSNWVSIRSSDVITPHPTIPTCPEKENVLDSLIVATGGIGGSSSNY